jgi:hypothetical protein
MKKNLKPEVNENKVYYMFIKHIMQGQEETALVYEDILGDETAKFFDEACIVAGRENLKSLLNHMFVTDDENIGQFIDVMASEIHTDIDGKLNRFMLNDILRKFEISGFEEETQPIASAPFVGQYDMSIGG